VAPVLSAPALHSHWRYLALQTPRFALGGWTGVLWLLLFPVLSLRVVCLFFVCCLFCLFVVCMFVCWLVSFSIGHALRPRSQGRAVLTRKVVTQQTMTFADLSPLRDDGTFETKKEARRAKRVSLNRDQLKAMAERDYGLRTNISMTKVRSVHFVVVRLW
jgi:hypothetical protein